MNDEDILAELANVRAQRAGRAVVGTQSSNADIAARANNLSRRLSIPADVIERNMTEIEQRDQATRNSRLVREAPAPVQRYFGEPRNAAAAKDDVEPMVNMAGRYPAIGKFSPARQPEAFGDIGIVRQTGRTVRETVTGIPSALASGLYSLGSQMESFIGATTDVLNAIDPKPAIAGFAGDVIAKYTGYNPRWDKSMEQTRRDLDAARVKRQAALKGEEEAWKPKSTSWIARDLLQGVSSVPATVAAMLTRDPKAASGTLGALVGAGEYDAARAQGLDIGSAIAYGARQGVVEGITEAIPASKLLGDIAARSPFGKMLMGQLASEIPGEQVATFLQDLDEWVTLNPDKTVGEFVRERPSAAGQTLLATIGGVGTTVGGAKLATTVVDQVTKVAQRRERRDIRSAAEAVEAQAGAQILDGMMSDAEAAKLRTTDPEAFRQYVEAITGGTAIETVYIPGEAIRELMQDGYRDAPFWSDHADQIDEALALDGDVALPFDQFATFVAGTPEWQTLRDDVRFSPGGMSMAELASIEEAYRADGEVASGRLAEQMEAAAIAAEPGAQVYAEMRDQFQNAGFRPDAADRYASIWAANREAWGELMGMTAAEYHAANPVNIRRVLPEGLAKALPVDGLDIVINAMRAPDKAERKGPSLLDFISKRGGVEDRGGNIASMGGGDWHKGKVGQRKLLKDFEAAQGDMIGGATSDNSLERTIEAARDAGYDVTDEASLLTAIGNELRGTPSFANEALTESETQRIRDAGEDLRRILIESNIDPDTATKKEIEAAIDRMRDVDPFEGRALEQGGEQPRGRVSGGIISGLDGPAIIELFENSDMSTVLHETAHVWLEELKRNAASPDAPASVVEDWQTVQDWFAANNVPMEGDIIPVEAHELWARGGERYFMEGKAPSTALQRAFDTFRGWLLNIYQVVTNLRSPITPEIRRVFDRMLATRDALDDASERQQLQARFESAEQAGMTQEAFAAYRALADEARTEAFNALLFRTMASIRKERTKEYQSQAASVRDDVTAAMNKRPDFRALHLLRTGRFLDDPTRDPVKVKISRDWLVENFGEDALGLMPKGVPPIYSENGAHPDMAANLSGFRSGEEMVRALMGLEQAKRAMVQQGDTRSVREAAIADEVNRIMTDRYGNPLDDGSIEEEALAAVANDKEAELIASENRALAKQAKGQPTAYSVARQWAARKIAQGRVVDVASKAALHRYARAQAKATKAFEVALLEGNVDEAFRQSELRLLNNALISEAKKAADKVETAVSRLSRTAKQRVRKSVDQEYFDRAQALLAKFEFMPRSQKLLDEMEAFASWAEKQAADGIDVAVPPRLESDGVHYTRMSVEELIGLDESVEQLLHLGRMKKTMLDNKERREFGEIIDEAVSTIEETPQRKKNNRMRPSWIDEQKAKVASYDAALLKMEQVFDWLDNGNPNGVFNRMVFQPLAEAQARAREMMTDYLGQVRDALRALPKDVVKKWEDKVDAPELLNRETGDAFELDRQTLISMAFNVGNEGNFDKLARGYGWNPETVMRVLQRELTAEEWRFVQSMWDMIDTLWPEVEALEKRINGVAPERVEARAFTVTVGDEVIDMRGGYFPVVYDPLKNIDTEAQQAANSDNLFSKAYRRATTPKGFTKERTEVARPILLSMSVLNRHLNEVIHDITHREPIIAANKILSDRRVIKAVDDSLGRAVRQQFRPWLQHIANEWAIDARGVQGWETIAKTLRTHSTMIGMGFRLSTIFAQVAGYAGVAEKVGTRWLADGMKAALARPVETFDFVMERSKEVAARMDTMERDINSNIRDLQGRTGVLAQTRRFAFYGIGYMDRVVVIPAWLGSYNKALSEGMTDDQAIHFADKVIRQTQGAGAAKDLAAIQRGSEWLRLASMFYSYASAFYNRQRNLGRDVKRAMTEKELSEFPGLLARAWWLFAVAPIMGALPGAILSGSGPDEDEDESWMGWALGAMAGNFFYGVPLARDVASSAVSGFDYGFTPASRMVTTLMDATGDLKALVDADDETDPSKRSVKTAVESVGYVARLPLGQFSNASQFIADWAAGEADPDGVGDWLTGLQRGKLEE